MMVMIMDCGFLLLTLLWHALIADDYELSKKSDNHYE